MVYKCSYGKTSHLEMFGIHTSSMPPMVCNHIFFEVMLWSLKEVVVTRIG